MIINNENFGEVVAKMLRAASEYHKAERFDTCGIIFDKDDNSLKLISVWFFVRVTNVKIEIDIPRGKPFYNVLGKVWTEIPYEKPVEYYMEKRAESYNFVGRTEYYANNILNIINKETEKVLDLRARYVFVQGFLPQGCAAITFKEENGKPVFKAPKIPKKFVIDENSAIPEKFVQPGITYACTLNDCGDTVTLDVITKFGKTRSGMFVSEVKYDSKCLPRLNNLEIIHPELTVCSNILETSDEEINMPPIHLGAMLLYDLLKILLICKTSKFNLHYQEKINDDIWIESVPEDYDDAKVSIFFPPYDYYKNIQRG